MVVAYWCVLIAAILPYILTGYAKFSSKKYNNHSPREFIEKAEGKAKRAHWAHINSFEAFPAFAASIILAQLSGVPSEIINRLAVLFILFRIFYGICYVFDKATLRSVVWFAGFACVISLFLLSIAKIQ